MLGMRFSKLQTEKVPVMKVKTQLPACVYEKERPFFFSANGPVSVAVRP